MKYNTIAKICGVIVFLDMAYMLYAEGSHFTWTVFFVFTVLAILFNTLDKNNSNGRQQPKN